MPVQVLRGCCGFGGQEVNHVSDAQSVPKPACNTSPWKASASLYLASENRRSALQDARCPGDKVTCEVASQGIARNLRPEPRTYTRVLHQCIWRDDPSVQETLRPALSGEAVRYGTVRHDRETRLAYPIGTTVRTQRQLGPPALRQFRPVERLGSRTRTGHCA